MNHRFIQVRDAGSKPTLLSQVARKKSTSNRERNSSRARDGESREEQAQRREAQRLQSWELEGSKEQERSLRQREMGGARVPETERKCN